MRYFSYAGAAQVPALHPLFVAQHVLAGLDPLSPNDGLVTVLSARYGQFQHTVALDHWQEVGWFLPAKDAHIDMLYRPISALLEKNRL